MSVEYKYENLSAKPSLGKLEKKVSGNINKVMVDHSYHPGEAWLKCWFDEELSVAEKAELDDIVAGAVSSGDSWLFDSGSVYFELVASGGRGWRYYRQRVNFETSFEEAPEVIMSNIQFDGLADVEIIYVSKDYFDYSIRTRTSRRSDEITSITFDWEAEHD